MVDFKQTQAAELKLTLEIFNLVWPQMNTNFFFLNLKNRAYHAAHKLFDLHLSILLSSSYWQRQEPSQYYINPETEK